ncbi:hypothetical protein Q9189_005625 [Teloschistes chrysophthalmus]
MNAHHHSRCTPGAALALVISTSLLSVYSSHNRSKSSALRPSNDFEPTHNRNGSVVHEPHGLALPCGREQLDAGSSSSVWAKRDLPPPLTYGRAVCIGNKLWNMIQDAYNGKGPKPQAFTLEDADNGWTTDENNSHLPDRWDDAYDLMVESVGGEDTTLSLIQHWILPDQNAIIAQYVNSPYNKLRSRNHPPPPPNSSLPDLVPPLHRLSDIAWLSWAELSRTPHTLQYIGHDYITNSDTKRIMNLIFRASAGVDWMGWPGLEFGVETWEGRALLGTPNSGNVAWLLVARAGVMGRRGLRVRIWAKGYEMLEPVPCLLWNMMVLE